MAHVFAKPFYDSALWQRTRREILRRDNYSCADCCGRADMVHHLVEITQRNITDYNITIGPDNLISLCHDCHIKRHRSQGDVVDGFVFGEDGQVVRG